MFGREEVTVKAWPDNDLKELLSFDLQGVFLSCSKPHLRIFMQQLQNSESTRKESAPWDTQASDQLEHWNHCANLLNDGHRLRRKEARVAHIIIDNAVEHLLLIITWERRLKEERAVQT